VDHRIRCEAYAVGCGTEQPAFDHRFQIWANQVEFLRIASKMMRQALGVSRAISQRLVNVL